MSEKKVTTCDGCKREITSAVYEIHLYDKSKGFQDHIKHACTSACMVDILKPSAWPELNLPAVNQKPPVSNGVYR